MIINFEGVIGDITCTNPFIESTLVKYVLRPGAEKGLKILQAKYQLIIVRQMSSKKFNKFIEYFNKRSIHFDAVYKSKGQPIDYSMIFKEFIVDTHAVILNSHETELGSSLLEHAAKLPLCSVNNVFVLLVPHLKLVSLPSLEQIANSIDFIFPFTNTKYEDGGLLEEDKRMEMNLYKNLASTLKSPYQRSRPKSTIPRKLYPLHCEIFSFQTNIIYQHIIKVLQKQIYLYNRWQDIRSKRQTKLTKNKTAKSEMLSNLMNSNLAAYDCLHLADQYSKQINIIRGKLSEAAIEEQKIVIPEVKLKDSVTEYQNVLVLSTSGGSENLDIIFTEQYESPYLNISKMFCKKGNAPAGRKKTIDLDSL